MSTLNRRKFLTMATGAVATSVIGFPAIARDSCASKVVVIGGGTGGAIAAKYIRLIDPTIEVTLVEQNKYYHTCFMSNEVLNGRRTIDSIKFDYDGLVKYGIKIHYDRAQSINPETKRVTLARGKSLDYDRLIIAPGIDFRWNTIEGYDESVIDKIPHAWKAGSQTVILRQQIAAMPNGGTVIIAVPKVPFRCPPGPYDRVSQIASYMLQHKPKSKLLILDSNYRFSKQKLFEKGWKQMYGYGTDNSMIEWVSSEMGGKVTRVDANNMTVIADDNEYKADVINLIPPQMAGRIAVEHGLVETVGKYQGWCPVNGKTFESKLHPNIHIIGDACLTKMPKSAFSASSQAKVCAKAVVAALQDKPIVDHSPYLSTCYSIVGNDYGISVVGFYRPNEEGKIVRIKGVGGLSPLDASPEFRKREVAYANSWYKNITHEMFQ